MGDIDEVWDVANWTGTKWLGFSTTSVYTSATGLVESWTANGTIAVTNVNALALGPALPSTGIVIQSTVSYISTVLTAASGSGGGGSAGPNILASSIRVSSISSVTLTANEILTGFVGAQMAEITEIWASTISTTLLIADQGIQTVSVDAYNISTGGLAVYGGANINSAEIGELYASTTNVSSLYASTAIALNAAISSLQTSSIQTTNAYPVYGVQPSRITLLDVDTTLEVGATITNTKQVVILNKIGSEAYEPQVFLDTTGFTDGQFITINPNGVSTIISTLYPIQIQGAPETTFSNVITLVALNNNWYSMQ
jgi:hypothetical protein